MIDVVIFKAVFFLAYTTVTGHTYHVDEDIDRCRQLVNPLNV